MDILYSIAILLLIGLLFGKIMPYFKLPNVTGYLLAGIVVGPYVTGIISSPKIDALNLFSTIALVFISFSIGLEFRVKFLKKMGMSPFIIALFGAVITQIVVMLGLWGLGSSIPLAIILGAIASSTAPAVIMMELKETKASGSFTNTLLSVVAIDDVISIIIFGFSLAIAKNMGSPLEIIDFLEPFLEIVTSILCGFLFGFFLSFLEKKCKSESSSICILLSVLFLLMICFDKMNRSPLLSAMVAGFTFINTATRKVQQKTIRYFDLFSAPFLILFFVLSGATLNLKLLTEVGIIGIAYFILRTIGKIIGASMGAKVMREKQKIVRYLGPALLSQTGLAIGLVLVATKEMPEMTNSLTTIVLASSFLFDLLSPSLVRSMLKRSKEIKI